METITLSGGGALQTSHSVTRGAWQRQRVTWQNVTMRNMTPTIILIMIITLINTGQTLFFGGVRNARQNDMWVIMIIYQYHDHYYHHYYIVTSLMSHVSSSHRFISDVSSLTSHLLWSSSQDNNNDGNDPEQVHLGLGLVWVDPVVRILSPGNMMSSCHHHHYHHHHHHNVMMVIMLSDHP